MDKKRYKWQEIRQARCLRHIGSSCDQLELLAVPHARLRPSAVASPGSAAFGRASTCGAVHSARNVLLMILMRQQELAFWRDSLELLHRTGNHARLLPPAAEGRSIAGTCGARNAILMILMRQQEPDS